MGREEGPPGAAPGAGDGGIAILYPLPRDRFILGRGDSRQLVRFEAVPDAPVAYVDWYVDGSHYARSGPPYSAWWTPSRGRHAITAATPGNSATQVDVTVE